MHLRPVVTIATLAALSLTAACSNASTAVREGAVQVVELDRPFSLSVGQSAALDAGVPGTPFRVAFVGITGDSRCPADAVCVWEGDARVALRLTSAAATADTAAHTTQRFTPDPALGAFRVSVEGLAPSPRTDRAITPTQYVVTLRVTRR